MTEHWYRRSQIAFYEKHRSRLALTCLRVYLRVRYALLSRFGDSDRRQRAQAVADSLRGAPDATPSVTTGDR